MNKDAKKKGKVGLIILVCLLAAVLGAGAFILYKDTAPPVVSLSPSEGFVSPSTEFTAGAQDIGSGLKSLSVSLIQKGKSIPLLEKGFPAKNTAATLTFKIEKGTIKDGNFTIMVAARDAALSNWGQGSERVISQNYMFDSAPPRISPSGAIHNIKIGGSGCVSFTLSEPVQATGVVVGETLYPAHHQPEGQYIALFPFPYNMTVEQFKPFIRAVDFAGNRAESSFNVRARERKFRYDRINIPDSFLSRKSPELQRFYPEEANPLEIYLKANNDLRAKNAITIREVGALTAPKQLWEGSFVRMTGATRSKFGDKRDYYYGDKIIDHQTHLGVDIARTLHASIPAANNGTVVFTGDLGIYGQTVIVDHGLGLQSLYAHMSRIDVQKGDTVNRKQTLGLTGTSGLAGGDHLHFGMYIDGMPVTPMEWWDAHWIKNNITSMYAD